MNQEGRNLEEFLAASITCKANILTKAWVLNIRDLNFFIHGIQYCPRVKVCVCVCVLGVGVGDYKYNASTVRCFLKPVLRLKLFVKFKQQQQH